MASTCSRSRNPIQVCMVSGGDGMAGTTKVATVVVTCTTQPLALFAGNLDGSGTADGVGIAARFNYPQGVAVDGAGNVYVADTDNNTIRVITPAGVVTTLAGQPGISGSADGTGAAARFSVREAWRWTRPGHLRRRHRQLHDPQDHARGRRDHAGRQSRTSAYSDGTGTAAGFSSPRGIATDPRATSTSRTPGQHDPQDHARGRRDHPGGHAGGAVGSADGTGAARFLRPGCRGDAAGNVYVADTGNNTIRKITPAGVVTTLAGVARPGGTATAPAAGPFPSQRRGGRRFGQCIRGGQRATRSARSRPRES